MWSMLTGKLVRLGLEVFTFPDGHAIIRKKKHSLTIVAPTQRLACMRRQ